MSSIGVIGKGKTGSQVIELLKHHENFSLGEIYSSTHPFQAAKDNSQAIVIFVDGNVFKSLIPELKTYTSPLIIGTTGFNWDELKSEKLKSPWIVSSNYSLAMQFLRKSLELLGQITNFIPETRTSIHEVHHTAKKDGPSGTALLWEKWLGEKCTISFSREGDVKGLHQLTLTTPDEKIFIEHEALNRQLFARGALVACEWALTHKLENKIYTFDELFDRYFNQGE